MTRRHVIDQVAQIFCNRIETSMDKILSGHPVRESSLVFKEQNYGKRKWEVETPTNGLASMMPFFAFQTVKAEDELSKLPTHKEIQTFLVKIMQSMRLSNEVCILALIFVEKLIKLAQVQILTINWNPILYTAVLLAAKYWEDF